jgi:6-phosphogluconolactonase/glucosamine-6-phosphate isomerase/deaminase
VAGHSKAEMVRAILGKEAHRAHFPAGLVHPANGQVTWFIDEEAASKMKDRR